jgi:Tol biopolymer transport system component
VAERSRALSDRSPRGRLAVGLVLVALVATGIAFGLGRLRAGPDLGRVVFATERGVYARELSSGDQRLIGRLPKDTLEVWPSADGRFVAYLRRHAALWMLDLDEDRRWQLSERSSVAFGWSPDGRLIASELRVGRDLIAVDPTRGRPRVLVNDYEGGKPVWRDAGRFFAALAHQIVAIRLSGSRPTASKVIDDAWPLVVSPDGAQLLYLIDPEGAKSKVAIGRIRGDDDLVERRVVFNGWAKLAAASPQGYVAFSARARSGRTGTWVLVSSSKPPRRVAAAAEELAWSPDGSSLIYEIDGKLYARDVSDGRTTRLSPRPDYVKGFAVVP